MSAVRTLDALAAVRDLRPQAYGTQKPDKIRNPIIEPLWAGLRVLAAIDGAGAGGGGEGDVDTLLVDDGEPVRGRRDIEAALAGALRADNAIIDGVLIKASTYDETAVDLGQDITPTTGQIIAQTMIGRRRNLRAEVAERADEERAARTFEPGEAVSFVALDLLFVDGEWLFDVPLLERKRQLESVLTEPELIRRGAFVRAPYLPWVGSWRAQGFSGLVFKAANGRYQPGGIKDDWVTIPMPRR